MSKTAQEKIIEQCVQDLIYTLGSIDADKADAIVKQVATSLMNDVLGKSGYIKPDTSAMLCGSSGCKNIFSYKWEQL